MLRIYFRKFFYVVFRIWSATSNRNILDPSRNYFIIFILHHDHSSAWSKSFGDANSTYCFFEKFKVWSNKRIVGCLDVSTAEYEKNQRGQFKLVLCINMDHLRSGLSKLSCFFTIETTAIFLCLQIMSDDNSSIFGNLVTFNTDQWG